MSQTIQITSLARLEAVAMAVLGLIAGLLYAVGGLVYDLFVGGGLNAGTALAFMAIPGMPLLFAAVGFLAGALHALLCNLVSLLWGIEFRISKE